ncbi:ADP-glyceromanno-heptose 6-epimerase [Nemorincola caseinilytica]|uniref:ADP-L-glycero-D-manno-heptose-6-epimerase n=1 Tax=Nemorincola caseinilytica TaxID=2054315 RepID=A0ABP8NMQ6_9BACT
MQANDTILITGAAGFIGSYLVGYLNHAGYDNLILADDFSVEKKAPNLAGKRYLEKVHRDDLFAWLQANPGRVQYVFHLGARTDTTEMDYEVHRRLNLEYSQKLWAVCAANAIPLVYASSAATYGAGEHGYKDDHDVIYKLQPLNPYGVSKNEFDKWALQQPQQPPFWAGLKFFNVFGPNEYHKGRMASVIFHAYNTIQSTGKVKLFRSHHPAYKDGEQIRDFIYVQDVVQICVWLMQHRPANGLYNTGTGKARTFNDLVKAIFDTLQLPANIEYIDTPIDIRDKYQYFTEADMTKLRAAGYYAPFHTLEQGVREYVTTYLTTGRYL